MKTSKREQYDKALERARLAAESHEAALAGKVDRVRLIWRGVNRSDDDPFAALWVYDLMKDYVSAHKLSEANYHTYMQLWEHLAEDWTAGEVDQFFDLMANKSVGELTADGNEFFLLTTWANYLRTVAAYVGAASVLAAPGKGMTDDGVMALNPFDELAAWNKTVVQLKKELPLERREKLDASFNAREGWKGLARELRPTPRPEDYAVTPKQLGGILAKLGRTMTARTIQRWDQYLRTHGDEGTPPPEDYDLYTRMTLAGATAWATTYADREKRKLKTAVSYDALTSQKKRRRNY